MAVFTAVGAYIATSVFGLAAGSLAAAVVGGVIATGAAMLTSRIINGSPGSGAGGGGAQSQGTRVQLSPSTENKIPVLYGEAYCSPIITDAYLDNENKTMTYVMVIAETCNVAGATYTVEDIYWNDLRLKFENAEDPSAATKGVKYVNNIPNQTPPQAEDHEDTHFNGKVWFNVYAGNTTAGRKIFGKAESARDFVNKYNAANWEVDKYRYEGLITAVLRLDYDAEKGFTGLPTLTFKLKNSVNNPAAVLADYMSSDRYGANIPQTSLDQGALAAFEVFCNESGPYKPFGWETGDPILTAKRYEINGLIDTSRTCKENIDVILANSGAWMSYDVALGKWRVIPKRALPGTTWSGDYQTGTPTDPAPQIIFNDDNITSGIQISSTRLDNLYNIAGVEYYDKYNKDQRGYVKIELDAQDRNYNEPDNALNLSLDLTNNNIQAERLANIELKQSRDDLVITFTTAHYGLQAQSGDVIAVYNTLYGWCEPTYPQGKYFRVLSTVEKEVGEGTLENEITALEYNSDVYSNESIQEFTTSANIGIIPRTGSANIPAPLVTIGSSNPNSGVPSFTINVQIPGNGGPFDELQIWIAEDWDWLGTGGDVQFKGQIFGTTLDVIQWQGPHVVRAAQEVYGSDGDTITNIGTTLAGQNVIPNTKVLQFGAAVSQQYGNGKTGQYTVTPTHTTNTGIRTMSGWVQDAAFTGTVSGNVLTVTTMSTGTIQLQSLVREYADVSGGSATALTDNSIIIRQLTGTTGSTGTYELSKTSTVSTPTSFVTSKPYPADTAYQYYRSIFTKPGFSGLFDQGELRDAIITGLSPNKTNKKYFVRCRLGIGNEYGPLSDINDVDLEAPTVYWNPDSQSALNIKTELVKMDFGKFTIPRNGLWLMRTATQLDGGTLASYNTDYFNLDLGNFDPEDEITSEDDIQDFTYDPND
jgi:hypothetical protein